MSLMTPFAVGEVPESVKRWQSGPPYGRLELNIEPTGLLHDGLEVYLDLNSGEHFAIRRNVPCGAGCRCAAEATWVPR